jgi:hypothetical protein
VGVVGVAHDVVREELPVRGADDERPRPSPNLLDGRPRVEVDAEFLGHRDDAVDDPAQSAVGVVDAEVEVDVAHQVVQRRRVLR